MVRRLTLSDAAHELAQDLTLLPVVAQDDTDDYREIVRSNIERIQKILASGSELMRNQGGKFATIGDPSDVVRVRSHHYQSAHHAAFGEATQFMQALWFHLDKSGYEATRVLALNREHDDDGTAIQSVANATGLDAQCVVDDWPRAKAGILELLTDQWRKDFATVDARIGRERAATEGQAGKGSGNKKMKPTPETLGIIRAIQRALTNDEIAAELKVGVGKVRTTRTRYNKGEYEI